MSTPTMGGLQAQLEELILDVSFGTGVQLSVISRDGSAHLCAGVDSSGSAMSPSAMHPTYCATKPVLAALVGHCVAKGLMSPDDQVRDLLRIPTDNQMTLADVLNHRGAGLQRPHATEWRMASEPQRVQLLAAGMSALTSNQFPSGYSEFLGWSILARVCEIQLGSGWAAIALDLVHHEAHGDIGLAFDMDSLTSCRESDLLRVPVCASTDGAFPMLSEITDACLRSCSLAFGGFASTAGLANFYWSAIRPAFKGEAQGSGLARLLRHERLPAYDEGLSQTAGFVAGMMRPLADFGFPRRVSAEAVGHVAAMSAMFGLYDPLGDIAIAGYVNGALVNQEDMKTVRRMLTTAALQAQDIAPC